jgi:SAM-dependent methyltransferase
MSRLLKASRRIWRAIVPASLRALPLAVNAKRLYYQLLGIDPRDAVYDADYYRKDTDLLTAAGAKVIADSTLADLKPSTVVDVGCGTGALLEVFRNRGCQVFGLEYAESALEVCRERMLDVQKFDLEKESLAHDRRFDVAVSMEVAEHLAEASADHYVALLTSLSNSIVFTAATPGQQGIEHVNEQPPSYWISKFRGRGFDHDETISNRWKSAWEASGSMAFYYHQNLMVFRRRQGTDREGDQLSSQIDGARV